MKIIKTYKINISSGTFNKLVRQLNQTCMAAYLAPYLFEKDEWLNKLYDGNFVAVEFNKKHSLLYEYSEEIAKLFESLEKLSIFN